MQKSVIEYLLSTATKYPKKVAVHDAREEITFQQLLDFAFVIADELKAHDVWKQPVGVYIAKSCKLVEAFAGISMSGNFYVPLDTKSPDSRINSILESLES